VHTDGAVGFALPADGIATALVSQGCRPVGRPFVVTAADENLLLELGGRPAIERLEEMVAAADDAERARLASGLHVGVVIDEHQVDFTSGDFLVRNVLGGDRERGGLVIGDVVPVGTTVQFQVRDAVAADQDLASVLTGHRAEAALVFTCNGRGRALFDEPDHDVTAVAELTGAAAVAGMFCAGEIGPVGGRNFLHGFTASMLLFER
jgi:small ligand-binding sensory domain FIST